MSRWITTVTRKIETLATTQEVIYKLAQSYYFDVIQKEVILANLNKDDHILCIGGGICPFTAILFHTITDAKVTVIDNDILCIPKAQNIIARFGLTKHIQVLHQDGRSKDFSFQPFTVVHFALQVSPMESVFSWVEQQVNTHTKLLLRRPKKQLKELYQPLQNTLLQNCPFTLHQGSRNIARTLLYIKSEETYEKQSKTLISMDFDAISDSVSHNYPVAV
ncbi:MAG: hypothetical protein FWE25_02795 [Lachnospiraceae bacterium]|nr:hypothetical protein [Lachnospiraceae bacterium]